jgi:hypothetical protein
VGVAAGGGGVPGHRCALVTRPHGVDCYDLDSQTQTHSWPLHAAGGATATALLPLPAIWDAAAAQHLAVLQATKSTSSSNGSSPTHHVICWSADHPPTAPLASLRSVALPSAAWALFAAAATRPRRARAEDMVLDDHTHTAGGSRGVGGAVVVHADGSVTRVAVGGRVLHTLPLASPALGGDRDKSKGNKGTTARVLAAACAPATATSSTAVVSFLISQPSPRFSTW